MDTKQVVIDTTTHLILQEQAFREAYSMALKSMIGGSGETTGLPNWLAEEAQAALKELETA